MQRLHVGISCGGTQGLVLQVRCVAGDAGNVVGEVGCQDNRAGSLAGSLDVVQSVIESHGKILGAR